MHYFVSDLHLFSARSNAAQYEDAFNERAATGSTFVLGGDIFDFDWSTFPSPEATTNAAIDWLHRFVTAHPDCQFHYLLGNHDCLPAFVNRLDELSASLSNLAWEPFYLRIGDVLMLHGDVANRHMDAAGLIAARATKNEPRCRPAYHHQLYSLAVKARLHKAISVAINPKRLVARRILSYLESVGHGVESGITDVYFGHTHVPMRQYCYQGVLFHNGGAAMPGLKFQILEVNLSK